MGWIIYMDSKNTMIHNPADTHDIRLICTSIISFISQLASRIRFLCVFICIMIHILYCDVKSAASRLFTEAFIQAQIKENIKAPCRWPLCGNSPVTGEFPTQRVSNAKMFPCDDVIMFERRNTPVHGLIGTLGGLIWLSENCSQLKHRISEINPVLSKTRVCGQRQCVNSLFS